MADQDKNTNEGRGRQGRNAASAEQPAEARDGSTNGRQNGKSQTEGERYVPRLKQKYLEEVTPAISQRFGYNNPMQVPRITKVVINIGMGNEARENAKSLDNAVGDLGIITGQKALITRAKKSIAQFKLRAGMPIGVMVTLRGPRMWDFLDRLMNISLARVRDFSGVSAKSFDGRGNYTLGLREQLAFPEIEYDKVDKVRGLEVSFVTTARTDAEGRRLLELLGMPFRAA